MASADQSIPHFDSRTLENLRVQIETTIRGSAGNRHVRVIRLVVSDLKRPNSRSYRAGGPIEVVLKNADHIDAPRKLWIKVANHPHSGFFDELRRLYDLSLQRNMAGLVPRPFAYDADTALLVTALVPGSCPLKSFLRSAVVGNTEGIVTLAAATGQWLARFHSLDWNSDGPSIEDWAATLYDRMIETRLYSKDIADRLVMSEEFTRARHIRLPATRLHKDFTLRNILCTEDGLNVIDWDAMGHPETPDKDNPWNDIGACLINIESQIRYFPLVRNGSLRLFEQAMLDSYEKSCPNVIGPRQLVSLLTRLRYDVELIGPSFSRAYTGMRGTAFRQLFRRRLCREIGKLART